MCGFDSFYLCLLKQKTLKNFPKKTSQKDFTSKKDVKKTQTRKKKLFLTPTLSFKKSKIHKKTNQFFYLTKQSVAMGYLSSRLVKRGWLNLWLNSDLAGSFGTLKKINLTTLAHKTKKFDKFKMTKFDKFKMTKFDKFDNKMFSKPTPTLFNLYRIISSFPVAFFHYSTIFKSYFNVFEVKSSSNTAIFFQNYRTPNLFNFFAVFYLKNKIQPEIKNRLGVTLLQPKPSSNFIPSKKFSRYWSRAVTSLKKIHSLLNLNAYVNKLNFLMNKKKVQPINYFINFPVENFFYIKKLTNVDLSYNKKGITLKQTFDNYSKFQRLLSFYENDLNDENLYRATTFKTWRIVIKRKHYRGWLPFLDKKNYDYVTFKYLKTLPKLTLLTGPKSKNLKDKLNVFKNQQIAELSLKKKSILHKLNFLHYVIQNNLLFKYLFFFTTNLSHFFQTLHKNISSLDSNNSFKNNHLNYSNINPLRLNKFLIKKKIIRVVRVSKFLPNVSMLYYNSLIRFIEFSTGKKIFLKFNPFITNSLTFLEMARCSLWEHRIVGFQKILGRKIFLKESLRLFYLSFKNKDSTLFTNWIKIMLKKISFWRYKLIFRYIKYAVKTIFLHYFKELKFKGFKLKLKGKISVAGNSRTRTLFYRIGRTSHSTFDNKINYNFTSISTFTGVLGLRVWFFF